MKKIKPQNESPFRDPKPKKKLGLKVPTIRMPHEDLIKPELKLELVESIGTQSTESTHSTLSTQSKQEEIAPSRDFQKTPNSITRKAIPEGVFGQGKAKHIYDVLYSLTRGFIQPKRTVRISKPELMKKAGIGERKTVNKGIDRLIAVGLIKFTPISGEHHGGEFEVFLYEEKSLGTLGTQSTEGNYTAKVLPVPIVESTQGTQSENSINIELSHTSKTLSKTNTESDDDLIEIRRKLGSAARGKTGRDLTKKDYAALLDVFELLITETEIAAARTNSISAYIPFMAENLRRRLHAKPKFEKKGTETKKDTVGRTSVTSAPKPLNEESRTNLLKTYREGLIDYGMEWVDQNKSYFTPEDWQWIKSNLEMQK